MRATFLLLIFVLVSSGLLGQNFLVDHLKNGAFINGYIGEENGQIYKGATIGYTINGRLDFALSASRSTLNHNSPFYMVGPSLSYLLVKQGTFPLSVGAFAEYEMKRWKATDLIRHNITKTGMSLYHKIRLSRHVAMVPGAYGRMDFTTMLFDSFYKARTRSYSIGVQNSLLLKTFSITPGVSYSQRGYFLSIKLGVFILGADHIESIY